MRENKALKQCLQRIAEEKAQKSTFWLLALDQPVSKALMQGMTTASAEMTKEAEHSEAFDKRTSTFDGISAAMEDEAPDFAHALALLRTHCPVLRQHLQALATESPRVAYLAARALEAKTGLTRVVGLLLTLVWAHALRNWNMLVSDTAA